jgi:murein DD-endopeptidase MepM/ murein hydrolase activator NlpD
MCVRMPRLRRAVVAGAWLAVASFALAVPLRVGADDTPLPPETVSNPAVITTTAATTTAVTTSVATTTEVTPTTTPTPTDSTAVTTTTAEATTTAATTTVDATTTAAATTTTSSAAPSDVTDAERPARAPPPAAQAKRRVAPVTTTAKPPKAGASPPTTLAALVPELVTGVVTIHFPGEQLPLTVTPPLEGGPYVFPVTGEAVWGDTYGAPRRDVAGGWHHGDDIVAALGTPVVAVADGTLNRVGWDRLGGWGLWVTDQAGNEFYYAHLSGYSKLALLSTRVSRGEVIGFVGNTGDAFTSVPHLHFEIHPRGLLQLGYGGAVDPTTYLSSWGHVRTFVVGRPFHPPLPTEVAWRAEALQNFRELLDARGLDRPHQNRGGNAVQLTSESADPSAGAVVAAAAPVATAPVVEQRSQSWLWALLGALLLVVTLLGALGWRRRRRTGATAG